MSALWKTRGATLVCWITGLVFLTACLPKIIQPAEFSVAIYRYQLVPHGVINVLAVFLPWLELVCAISLCVIPRLRRGALILVILMLIIFTAAISINLYRGIDIACGCFSVNAAKGHLGWLSLLRNTTILIASAWALRVVSPHASPQR